MLHVHGSGTLNINGINIEKTFTKKLIEKSSMKIAIKQKDLNRELTIEEKNKILDECYIEM